MNRIPIWVLFISFVVVLNRTNALDENTRTSLYMFLAKLSSSDGQRDPSFGWNLSSDPCKDQWHGVFCDLRTNNSVRRLQLDRSDLSGTFDARLLCNVKSLASSLTRISLSRNMISGGISADIVNCKHLTGLHVSRNQLSRNLPGSLSRLNNLKRLDVSNNMFSGDLPDLSRISGLTMFLAENNQLTGNIPDFDFTNLEKFNVSNNNLKGRIPDVHGLFLASCFLGNPELCGDPLPNKCPDEFLLDDNSKGVSKSQILMYSGYIALALVIVALILCRVATRKKKELKVEAVNKVASMDDSFDKHSASSGEYKTAMNMSKSGVSVNSAETSLLSSSPLVLTSRVVTGLKFEDLLKAPAELLGRGKHGTLYKVILDNGIALVVKRVKDWAISSDDFKKRMQRLDQAKHPNVLPALAFYCSNEEKLLVYEYQQNGSLFRLLHGTQIGKSFNWASRLDIAARVAEALAFMHQALSSDGIAHGNLKSSNVLLNKNMDPCISEYGLMAAYDQDQATSQGRPSASSSVFKADIYSLGEILLELLTGKLVQNDGINLAVWVHSVVREEWTAEVFDKSLILKGASEERMVTLLQVALKCVNSSPEARPSINKVAAMINRIKEEEERSVTFEA